MSPRILVTGGSGFIGGHVAAAVREVQGDTPAPVRLVLRDPAAPRGGDAGAPAADVVRADLTDPPLESWLREHLIDRIPGASHES